MVLLQVNSGFAPSHALSTELNVPLRAKLRRNRGTVRSAEEENAERVAAGEGGEEREKRKRCARNNPREFPLPPCRKNEPRLLS